MTSWGAFLWLDRAIFVIIGSSARLDVFLFLFEHLNVEVTFFFTCFWWDIWVIWCLWLFGLFGWIEIA